MIGEIDKDGAENNKSGSSANITWRSVSQSHLAMHPLYTDLRCDYNSGTPNLSNYPQDSWQWSELHRGRLTTSNLASCLGFYESVSADRLGIPNSLKGHNRLVAAWQHLRQKPPANWSHLSSNSTTLRNLAVDSSLSTNYWSDRALDTTCKFAYHYSSNVIDIDSAARQYRTAGDARLAWGSAQEATAVLAALNYFNCNAGNEENATIHESGMCVFEEFTTESSAYSDQYAQISQLIAEGSLPLLGASPDGIVRHLDGRTEVLEVKCVSPYQDVSNSSGSLNGVDSAGSPIKPVSGNMKWCERYLQGQGGTNNSLGVWHVPQLQLEMLCAGPTCSSAVIVVLYVNGATIYRVRRSDDYIQSMLRFVSEFFVKYIKSVPSNKMKAPPINHFNPNTNKAYNKFLQDTIDIAQSAELVAALNSEQIQRSSSNDQYFVR